MYWLIQVFKAREIKPDNILLERFHHLFNKRILIVAYGFTNDKSNKISKWILVNPLKS